jgi:hypothetical protein
MPGVKFGSFRGMDNIHEAMDLPRDVLRRAINADVLDSGRLKRRKGFSTSLAIVNAHSLWSDGAQGYFVASNVLRRFLENGTSLVVGNFAAGDSRVSYVKVNADLYLICATARGRVRDGVLSPWGVEVPTMPPTLAVTVGVLPAGVYYAAVTYLLADGRESGASVLSSVTLTAEGGIATTAMPNPVDSAVTKKRLYLSTAGGEELFMAAEVTASSQFTSIGAPASGARLRTVYLSPPPFGRALATYNGWIFIVDASNPRIVWYTESLDFDHVDTRKNYYQFGADVTVIAAVTDGLYVCADQTYFLPAAGSKDAGQRIVLEIGAIEGSAASIPLSADVIWMTERGPVIGKDGGVVELLADKAIASGGMISAASMVREKDGLSQFVVVGSNTQESALQAGSYAEAEIVRRAS